ncbi:MAG TPA: hypothetical protein VGS59_03425 [Candidatus Acidoferrales bacterium]|nr:hypothetical protein [Candidatus Acidoferrales bacterium]
MTLSIPKSVSSLSKSILVLAVSLAFATFTPAAFAQRGGGGHAGGHVGATHGGAVVHATGGAATAHSVRAAVSASGARATGASGRVAAGGAGAAPEHTSTRGYSRNTFLAPSGTRDRDSAAASHYMPVMSESSHGSRAFAADNYFWEDPPQQGRPASAQTQRPVSRPITQPMTQPMTQAMARPFVSPPPSPMMHSVPRTVFIPMRQTNPLAAPFARPAVRPMPTSPARLPGAAPGSPFLGDTPGRPVVFSPFVFNPSLSNPAFFFRFHPIGGCFSSFNCFGFGFGPSNPFFLGFGFGPCFSGGFGCGFGPFGFGDLAFNDFGFGGFGNGWFYPPAPEIPPPPVNPTQENPPLDFAPNYYFLPEVPEPQNTQQKPTVKLVLKDGTIFDVYSYWLDNNQLFYITTYNIKTSIPVDDLDLQKTVDLNQKLGVTFTLSNKPPDQQQPPEEQQQPEQPE